MFTARCVDKYPWCFHFISVLLFAFLKKKINLGSCWRKDILKVKGHAQITKCYFLWVDAMNMQSLSGHYLMRQKVPMVFSLHLVCISTAACISEKINLGPCWRRDILRVKGQAQVTKCYFLWVAAINMQSLSGHYLIMHQQVPQQVSMVFLLLLVYLGAVAYISVEISLGSCWRRNSLRVKGQALITNCNVLRHCVICNHRLVTTQCAIKYPWCFYFF